MPLSQFFTFNVARKKCGLRKFAPGGRSFSVGNLSGLKNESPSEWKKIENSVYVGRKFKTSTAGNCKTACDIDSDCSTMIYNQFIQQCSINYGSAWWWSFQGDSLPSNNPLGISSYQKCTAQDARNQTSQSIKSLFVQYNNTFFKGRKVSGAPDNF